LGGLPPLMGWLLDRAWDGPMAGGAGLRLRRLRRRHRTDACLALVALLLVAFTRETHCR